MKVRRVSRSIVLVVALLLVYVGEQVYRTNHSVVSKPDVLGGIKPPNSMVEAMAWRSFDEQSRTGEKKVDGEEVKLSLDCTPSGKGGTAAGCGEGTEGVEGVENPTSPLMKARRTRDALQIVLKKYNIRSIVDVPCAANAQWMPEFLVKLDYEVPGFQYHCVDDSEHTMNRLRHLHPAAGNAQFLSQAYWKQLLPKADLALSIGAVQNMAYADGWSFMLNLKHSGIKYIILESNGCTANEPEPHTRDHINLLKPPFRFKDPIERFPNISIRADGLTTDLFFYEIISLPLTL